MSKTLLVLAASTYQLPTIETAKRLGYRVITTDNEPSNPGHALADASYQINTTDLDGVLRLATKERISGVIAPGTDVAVATAGHVAELLGLPGPKHATAKLLTQKHSFRTFLKEAGFTCPCTYLLERDMLPERGLFDGRKWLVKPNRSSGSKGVFILKTEAEFFFRIAESRSFSIDGMAVLEEFIEGTQHTCEGILENGRVLHSLVTDRDTAPPPHTATMGHRVPSRLSDDVQVNALCVIESVFDRLGVTSGPFDCDFVADSERIVLIEITPRLGGNSLSCLFQLALDIDLVAYAVATACGDTFSLPAHRAPKAGAIAILGVGNAGLLSWSAAEADALRKLPWVDTLVLDVPQGGGVEPFINGRHRVGEALIKGTDRNDVDARLLEFKRRLALAVA